MKHYHKASYIDGKLTDECSQCGKSLRDTDIHVSSASENRVHQPILTILPTLGKRGNE